MATFYGHKVDVHHIFPKAWCDANGVDRIRRESIVNKTALSHQTNMRIGKRSPAEYLLKIEREARIPSSVLDDIVSSHAINPKHLRAADFDVFFPRTGERSARARGECHGQESGA